MKYLILFLTISCSVAFGRLGETREQCIERYGAPITKESNSLWTFSKSAISIKIWFNKDLADKISYAKPDRKDWLHDRFSDDQVNGLLGVNGLSSSDEIRPGRPEDKMWNNDQKKIRAILFGHLGHRVIEISFFSFSERRAQEVKDKALEKVPGF